MTKSQQFLKVTNMYLIWIINIYIHLVHYLLKLQLGKYKFYIILW